MNKNNFVTFEEEQHKYTNVRTNEDYISCTTLIGEYKQPFDPYKKLSNGKTLIQHYVDKNGETEEYWLKLWEDNKDNRCKIGSDFHKKKELGDLANDAIITDDTALPVIPETSIEHLRNNYHLLPSGIYTELTIWNHYYKVAGKPDKIYLYDSTFDIEDYKTNKKFKTESYYDKRQRRYVTMKFPLMSIQDCHLQHYTLQLSLYAYMLECLTNKTCNTLRILYHPPIDGDEDIPQEEAVVYEVPYLKNEVLLMLNHYRKKPILYGISQDYHDNMRKKLLSTL